MIIWLASYPKSGNTWVRSFVSSLLFAENAEVNLKKIEINEGFSEAIKDKKTGKIKNFFHLGPENKWENILDKNVKENIEREFEEEMKDLGYL